jgi:hypothetical protein
VKIPPDFLSPPKFSSYRHEVDKTKLIWVEITATEQELELYSYKPLISGGIYQAEISEKGVISKFYDVFYDDYWVIKGVWSHRLKVLTKDELREHKLKELGI